MEENIEHIRMVLDKQVTIIDAKLGEGKILEVSKQFDMLIALYYNESSCT